MTKYAFSSALLSATGWFIGLLFVMIVVTALFAIVLIIALKPIKKFEPDDDMSKKLERRETELTIALLKNSNDPKRTEVLLKELREVTAAEKLVNRINEEEARASQPKPAVQQPARPKKAVAPQQAQQQAKPAPQRVPQQRPPQPAQAGQRTAGQQPKPAQPKPQPAPQRPAQAKPQAPQQAQAKPVQQPKPSDGDKK